MSAPGIVPPLRGSGWRVALDGGSRPRLFVYSPFGADVNVNTNGDVNVNGVGGGLAFHGFHPWLVCIAPSGQTATANGRRRRRTATATADGHGGGVQAPALQTATAESRLPYSPSSRLRGRIAE